MNEEEAKQKWCPHAFASHTDPRNGFQDEDETRTKTFPCIASKCMAWRIHRYQFTSYHGTDRAGQFAEIGYQPKERELQNGSDGKPLITAHGYCGLSGEPS